jgi:riboflavin synthase
MFTGIIEKVGRLVEWDKSSGGASLRISHDPWDVPPVKGDSIAVQGVCLTVTSCDRKEFACDVLDETLARSNLKSKSSGAHLNLERALRAGDRLGGHIISGHVDGTGRAISVTAAGRDQVLRIECGADLMTGIIEKGSVACDGASLTVSAVGPSWFDVNIIPFTWQQTSLSHLRPDDTVNIETDILGKYVRHNLKGLESESARNITMEDLQRAGFV